MEKGLVLCMIAHGGRRQLERFAASILQSQRKREWELFQPVLLSQAGMSSVFQDWKRFSLVFRIVISHCSLTSCFPDVTRNTSL